MIGGHQNRVAVLVLTPAKPCNGIRRPEQALRGEFAKGHDHDWLDGIDLTEQERLALLHFVGLWIAIAGWAALDHVGNVHVFPPQSDGLDDSCQELPGPAHE